jgi:hypothetical protein
MLDKGQIRKGILNQKNYVLHADSNRTYPKPF